MVKARNKKSKGSKNSNAKSNINNAGGGSKANDGGGSAQNNNKVDGAGGNRQLNSNSGSSSTGTSNGIFGGVVNNSNGGGGGNNSSSSAPGESGGAGAATGTTGKRENLDALLWLRECEQRRDADGEPYLQLEYQEDDELMQLLQQFLEQSAATKVVIDNIYQIWQQTVLSTLLSSSALWKKDNVTSTDQRQMRDKLKQARYKINFIMHHAVGSMLTSTDAKWKERKSDLLQLCFQTLQLLPRLAESVPHHKTDIRQVIIHFEGKEFLASAACETWDTLYDFSIPINPDRFIPILRRCAMLDILDKDWNMLGGWEDILKGLEAKCCLTGPVVRLPCDSILHEHTTILRNARNSMQCKFFSVRFMRYTEDQAPQRWRYFPKCSAPACANIETAEKPHPFRCKRCWYFHYCSESCQEYCDNIMGLHPKFCRDTPANKAALCQKETEQYLGWTSDVGADGSPQIVCHACGMSEDLMTENSMKRCSKCQKVYYCSRQCQEWDWRAGGHKRTCKPVNAGASPGAQGSGGSAVVAPAATSTTCDPDAGSIKDLN